jgi:hypothetical protein
MGRAISSLIPSKEGEGFGLTLAYLLFLAYQTSSQSTIVLLTGLAQSSLFLESRL